MNERAKMYMFKRFLVICLLGALTTSGTLAATSKKTSIYDKILPERKILEICGGHQGPVIKQGDPGTEDNKYGFEGGRAFKYKGEYHLFTAELCGDPIIVKMRMAHWKSRDGIKWQRVSTLYESSGNFTGEDPRAALWAPMPYYNEKEGRWNLFYTAYRCKPNDPTGWYENHEGRIWRAVSTVPGYDGLDGPYEDVGIVLEPGPDSDPWEGLQGNDSFYAYQIGNEWYALYGSAQTQTDMNPDYPKWCVGLARAPAMAGAWKRCSEMNPIKFHPVFAENPIVVRLADGRYSATLDGGTHTEFGYSFSDDGIRWSKASFVDIALEFDQWWTVMRTPLGLIPEDDGTFTVFYTAYTDTDFASVGMVKLKEVSNQSDRLYLHELHPAKIMQAWGDPQRNKSITGTTMNINGCQFKKGVGTHAESRIYIDTKNSVKRFVSYVGLDKGIDNGRGTIEFYVIGDDKILWQSGVMKNNDDAKKIDIDTTGVKLLLLYASDAGDGNGADHADWADAYFIVDGDKPVITWPEIKGLSTDYVSNASSHEMGSKKENILPEKKILEICGGHQGPVINQGDPGTEDNKYGFEGGRAFKYKGEYHLFTAELVGDPIIVKLRLAHWKSKDGIKWQRLSTLYESSGDHTGADPRASLWAPMPYYNEKEGRWNLFYVAYRSKPNDPTGWYEGYEGRIWRAVSTVPGYDGLDGPYEDVGVILEPGPDSDPWEGLQGTDSFYAYQVGNEWYGFYGSAQTQTDKNPDYPTWCVGLVKAPEMAGPWKRCSEMNPVLFHPVFSENPIVVKLKDGRYSATLDSGSATQFGYSFSDDGIHWSKAAFVDLALEFDQWWTLMRTPLGLIPEDDGTYTVFYTAYTKSNFACVGMVKLKEIDLKD